MLAAYGVEAWGEAWPLPRRRRTASLLLVAGIGFAVTLSVGVMVMSHQYGRSAWGLAVVGTLSGALLLWGARIPKAQQSKARRPAAPFAWLAVAVVIADLLSFGLTLFRLPSVTEVSAQGRGAAEWLAAQPGTFRTYSPSYSLPQPAAIEAGLQQIDGVEPVHLTYYDQFMAVAGGYDKDAFSVTIPPFPDGLPQGPADLAVPDLSLLGLLNGRYLVSAFPLEMPGLTLRWREAGTLIYENALTLPRAFVVHQTELMSDTAIMDQDLTDLEAINLENTALVYDGQPLDGPQEPTTAQVAEQSPNRVVVQTALDAPGLLVLGEIWYPGWQARDNGHPTSIVRTDATLRGVYLEEGSHTVEFVYKPWTVQAGLIVSVATALALAGYAVVCLIGRWRRR